MPYVVRVLVAYQHKFHDSAAADDDINDVPLWIPEVSKMLAIGQPRNLRLFAIKVGVNCLFDYFTSPR